MSFTSESARAASQVTKLSLAQKFAVKPTRKSAIDLFCSQCMGGPGNRPWKQLIRDCTAPKCPLYQYRPYKPLESV